MTVSNAFRCFFSETPAHAQAWMDAVKGLDAASALDKKTQALAYLAVLAAQGLTSGIPFHTQAAKHLGATREEVLSALLVGLPAAGHVVLAALPVALEAFDAPAPGVPTA